jgi:hypothetical protein
MNKNILYIYFNKISKLPAFFSLEKIKTDNLLVREIDVEADLGITEGVINLARYKWEGDYDSGTLVDLFEQKKAIVTEKEIDEKYNAIFYRKYPFDAVISNLISALYTPKTDAPDILEMAKFHEALLNKKKKEIEFYKSSVNHIFETREYQEEREKNTFRTK